MDLTVEKLIVQSLEEDIGPGDITTDYLIDTDQSGEGYIIAKEPLVIAGLDIAKRVFEILDSDVSVNLKASDGDMISAGMTVLEISGRLRTLLKGERTALNFIQRLSGISTNVRDYIEELGDSSVRLVDTRKTIPGWRALEKYAVRIGGAYNHRMALYDGVLIKDNHIAACGSITAAVGKIRRYVSHLVKIEVEVTDFQELNEALDAGADVIMLDNMNHNQIREAVGIVGGRAVVEASGSVRKDRLKELAETGIDIISSGALTHQARAVDLSMRIK